MRIHPAVTQQQGVISVTLQAVFKADVTDVNDRAKINAFGDPKVNIAGTFVDPNDFSQTPFTFQFPASELFVGITTDLMNHTARFMTSLPPTQPGQSATVQGPLDCVTTDPARAAQVWVSVLDTPATGRIAQSVAALRALVLIPVLSDTTI